LRPALRAEGRRHGDGRPLANRPTGPPSFCAARRRETAKRYSLLGLIVVLQDHERALHDGLLPGAEIAAPYLGYVERQVAENDGALLVAESDGAVVG